MHELEGRLAQWASRSPAFRPLYGWKVEVDPKVIRVSAKLPSKKRRSLSAGGGSVLPTDRMKEAIQTMVVEFIGPGTRVTVELIE